MRRPVLTFAAALAAMLASLPVGAGAPRPESADARIINVSARGAGTAHQHLTLALDKDRLAGVRTLLAANRQSCALFDTDRFRRHMEAAYRQMHTRLLRGEPPASFSIHEAAVEPA